MPAATPPRSRPGLPPDTAIRLAKIDAWAKFASKLPLAVSVGFSAFCMWQIVEAISGKMTFFSAGANVDVSAAFPVGVNLPVVIALVCSIMLNGFQLIMLRMQRRHNEDTIRHFARNKQQLETLVDPTRTSSGLAEDGSTHPRDL